MVKNSIRTAKITALISFVIGTILFIFFNLITYSYALLAVGVFYTAGAFFINSFVLLHILFLSFFNPNERKELLITCGIMLLNIPIAMGYVALISYIHYPSNY